MTDFRIDLEGYLARIGFDGVRAPTRDTLSRIILQHQMAIAFENLNSFSGLPVVIDPAVIERKILHEGRGGYCHEQNQYLRLALMALGFEVKLRMARVRWMQPPEVTPPRAHMSMIVKAEGQWYLSDVAFGAMTPTAPLRLDTTEPQATPHQTYRMNPKGDSLHLEVRLGEEWRPVYSIDDVDCYPVDFEAANWFVSTNPKSDFVKSLILARPTQDRRQILNNTTLSIRDPDGSVRRRTLADIDELRTTLRQMFGITLPTNVAVDRALERVFQNEGSS
ncbi:MAG TPA: arylamine N-acetyltransferase [Xanthobacteraceae bacterium]|nr:arylamine N-acetyltransferase [Xanthobacteraceae bacterium]